MTVSVYYIEGSRHSICRNSAFAVVAKGSDGTEQVLDIIPLYEIPGKTGADVRAAFTAATQSGATAAARLAARAALGAPAP